MGRNTAWYSVAHKKRGGTYHVRSNIVLSYQDLTKYVVILDIELVNIEDDDPRS